MHRRLSTLMKGSSPQANDDDHAQADAGDDDIQSKLSTTAAPTIREEDTVLAPPSFKVKRVDYYYSWWTRNWKYRNTGANVVIESIPTGAAGGVKDGNDPWKDFLFVVVRTIPQQEMVDAIVKIVIKSPYILKACKDVIQSWPGISWNAEPLELDPEIFLIFYDQFVAYKDVLQAKENPTQEETYICKSVDVLLTSMANDYKTTLATLRRLTSHGEISWDLLPYILVPRTILVARCVITGQPRLFKLCQWTRVVIDGRRFFQLILENVDLIDRPTSQSVAVGRASTTVNIGMMKGVVKIQSLDIYPIRFFGDENGMKEQGLRQMAVERGKKWFSYFGIHHVQYDGIAASRATGGILRHHVEGRIMVDRATFKRSNPNYRYAVPVPRVLDADVDGGENDARWGSTPQNRAPATVPPLPQGNMNLPANPPTNPVVTAPYVYPVTTSHSVSRYRRLNSHALPSTGVIMESDKGPYEKVNMEDYSEEDYLLASTLVYGFSLVDKMWLEFSVSLIRPVEWNTSAFPNLVIPPGRKDLLKSLIETHHKQLNFDDFIKGKGHGLVINLFGPPGVGKTFSAEATSEHVQKPLYVVGAGDLGTDAAKLDAALSKVFELATAWKAIVLIDEADVFLEQRSLHDLQRNAMVAVFLRHVEYYRGILFLTTNRVKTFDEAFLSRIHVALHFTELSVESKIQVWKAFLRKVNALAEEKDEIDGITEEQVNELSARNINGRQIKNAVRTAQSLAVAKGQKLAHSHVLQTLDVMQEFTREFEKGL